VYGNDKLDYKSINKKYETGVPTERMTVTTEMVKDLRSSHFPIGFEGPTYTSEQKSNYTPKPYQAV
jgi:hypothetical protein